MYRASQSFADTFREALAIEETSLGRSDRITIDRAIRLETGDGQRPMINAISLTIKV